MTTRRSPRGQERLYKALGADLARAARPTAAELAEQLRQTLVAFEIHLKDESKARGLDVAALCPCWTVEVRDGRELLERWKAATQDPAAPP